MTYFDEMDLLEIVFFSPLSLAICESGKICLLQQQKKNIESLAV